MDGCGLTGNIETLLLDLEPSVSGAGVGSRISDFLQVCLNRSLKEFSRSSARINSDLTLWLGSIT